MTTQPTTTLARIVEWVAQVIPATDADTIEGAASMLVTEVRHLRESVARKDADLSAVREHYRDLEAQNFDLTQAVARKDAEIAELREFRSGRSYYIAPNVSLPEFSTPVTPPASSPSVEEMGKCAPGRRVCAFRECSGASWVHAYREENCSHPEMATCHRARYAAVPADPVPSWRAEVVAVTDPPAYVQWFEDTPVCTEERCPQYDGKRCRAVGWKPDRFCEPVVAEMTRRLDANTPR